MKILLRSRETKLYYAGDGEWKREPEAAIAFPSSVSAWKLFLSNFNGEPMELVYTFEDPANNFFLPIEPRP
jgi:hypothetical protein